MSNKIFSLNGSCARELVNTIVEKLKNNEDVSVQKGELLRILGLLKKPTFNNENRKCRATLCSLYNGLIDEIKRLATGDSDKVSDYTSWKYKCDSFYKHYVESSIESDCLDYGGEAG